MKLKNVLLSLSLAGFCFTQASAQSPQHSRHIGDGGVSSASGDMRPEAFRSNSASLASDTSILAPTATGYASHDGSYMSDMSYGGGCDVGCCDAGCDSGCAGACGGSGGLLSGLLASGGGSGQVWFTSETLLWFAQNQRSPALVTISPAEELPVLPTATEAFGGASGIDSGLLPGFRVEAGMYLDPDQKVGVSGRAFGIFESNQQYALASTGDVSIGIPFFNLNSGTLAEDAFLVAFTGPGNTPVSVGDVHVRSDLDMVGAEGSLRMLLARSGGNRVDLIGGYTYNRLKNSIGMQTNSTNLFNGDLIPDGTQFATNEVIETENNFNGGHLGLLSTVTRRGVSLRTLAKVSFGNMHQQATVRGFTTETFGGVTTATSGGILATAASIGTFEQNVFAFMPELGLQLGLRPTDNLELSAGYTFMMWSSVGLAGDQINRVLDSAGGVTPPAPNFVESSFWMQGIDLGATLRF